MDLKTQHMAAEVEAYVGLIGSAFQLANRAVTADIVSGSVPMQQDWPDRDGVRTYDTRPMIDPREHSPEVIDMSAEALRFADATGLIERHPERPYLVRLRSDS